jgi:ParB family chromosome partitioning protein
VEIDLSALDAVMALRSGGGSGTASDAPQGAPLSLPLELIDEDPGQPRTAFDEQALRELATTIAERGVRQPISVRTHPEQPGRWMLNFGARRLRASQLAGKSEIPAFLDETADTYDQVIENEQRESLQPLELALFIQRRLRAGDSQAEIARRLGKSRMYITYLCTLIDAPAWLMALYREGKCRGVTELHELSRLHTQYGAELEHWAAQRSTISRSDLKGFKTRGVEPEPSATSAESFSTPVNQKVRARPQRSRQPARSDAGEPDGNALHRSRLLVRWAGQVVELLLDLVPQHEGQFFVRAVGSRDSQLVSGSELTLMRWDDADA